MRGRRNALRLFARIVAAVAGASLLVAGCSTLTYRRNFTHPDRPFYADSLRVCAAPSSDTIRVVSFNVQFAERMGKVLEQLSVDEIAGAEIVLLQEVDSEGVRRVAERFGYRYVYFPAVIHPHHGREFGNAILTTGKIGEPEKILLPHHDPNHLQRAATFARLELRGRRIGVYSVHLGLRIAVSERGDQAAEVVRHIETHRADAVIVGGDFNTFNRDHLRVVREEMTEIGLLHISQTLGWTHTIGFLGVALKRLGVDHFFVRGVTVLECARATPSVGASDHEPIYARIALR